MTRRSASATRIDPLELAVASKRAEAIRARRLTQPSVELPELLPVDLVVLSHHHGDHFDEVAERDLPKDVPIVTTAHAAKKLRRQGFLHTHVLDTWESTRVTRAGTDLTITALPAKHAPQPLRSALPPVMGSMLDYHINDAAYRIYITGDTLLHDRLREIPERYPGIDLASCTWAGPGSSGSS